jgi:hypothetical protein
MPRKFNIAITYEPKIGPVRSGECKQTIRTLEDHPHKKCKGRGCPRCNFTGIMKAIPKSIGDLIQFHGWSGRPYHSPWSWRTEYFTITRAFDCTIHPWGLLIPQNQPFRIELDDREIANWYLLDWLARLDGIVPGTGEELGRVLVGKNVISSSGVKAQIIRWE